MGKVQSLWEAFKWLAECPGREKGVEKWIGVLLYVCCLATSIAFVIAMFQGSQSNHVGYESEGGDSSIAVQHHVPDFVACPRERVPATHVYNVEMNPESLMITGISEREIDSLAGMHQASCPQGETCDMTQLQTFCDGTRYENYCRKLDAHFMTRPHYAELDEAAYLAYRESEPWIEMRSPMDQVAAVGIMKRRSEGRWTLEMLWTALIYPGYGLIGDTLAQKVNITRDRNGLNCYFYKSSLTEGVREYPEMMVRQHEITKTTWIGNSLCMMYLGSRLPPARMPFFGCQAFRFNRTFFSSAKSGMYEPPYRYWLGNMAVNTLRAESFYLSYLWFGTRKIFSNITKPVRVTTGVVHYNMILSKDSTAEKEKCIPQRLVRGLSTPCSRTGENEENWYYELTHQARALSTVWVYGKTKITIEKRATFTFYTKFQIGAGIFGCLLGMSVAQVFETLLLLMKKCIRKQKGLPVLNGCRIAMFTLLFFGSIALTLFDMATYVNQRYTTIFNEKTSELEIPVCKLCPANQMDYSFLNRTKIAELNLSLQLYGYLKFAGMFRYPLVNLITKTKQFENGTHQREVPSWMVRNYRPPRRGIERCDKYSDTCINWQRSEILDNYIPYWSYYPWYYEDSKSFFQEMAAETRELEVKLGLPRNSPLNEIIMALHLDPKQLVPRCRVQNQDISDCWKYIKYTYIGERMNCLELKIPKSVITTEYDYGYENGLFIEFDHEPWYRDSDVYAYYGPNVPEAKRNEQDTICNTGTQELSPWAKAEGFEVEVCSYAGGGWKFLIQLQSYSMDEIEYRYRPMLQPASFSAEVRTGFKYNDLASNCKVSAQPLTCRHPREEFVMIMRSIHFETHCSCSICYGNDQETKNKMMVAVTEILGRRVHCCTDIEFYDCLSDKMQLVDWKNLRGRYLGTLDDGQLSKKAIEMIGEFRKESDYGLVFNWIWGPAPLSQNNALESADHAKIKGLFLPQTYKRLTNSSIEKLIQYAKSCFKEPCKVETLELMSLQPKPSIGNVSSIGIFYSTNIAYGMEIIDMLDPVQLAATLVAGYSATFGISLLGLIELIILVASNWKNFRKDSTAAKMAGRQHLLKTLSQFAAGVAKNPQTCPDDSQEEKITKVQPNHFAEDTNEKDSTIDVKKNCAEECEEIIDDDEDSQHNQACMDQIISIGEEGENGTDEKEKRRDSQEDSAYVDRVINIGEENEPETGTKADKQDFEKAQADEDNVISIEEGDENLKPHSSPSTREKQEPRILPSYLGDKEVSVLLVILVLLCVASLCLIGYFFFTFANVLFDGQISEAKSYEPPSIVLCVESKSMVKPLTENIAKSSCTTHEGSLRCSDLFQTFFRNRQNRFCLMMDNSRKLQVADDSKDDLVMHVPETFPPVMVGAVSLNRTSLEKIYPFTEWKDEHAVISYAINLRESQDSECLSEIERKPCEPCPNNVEHIRNPSICCFGSKESEPAITPRQTCAQYSFGVRITQLAKEVAETGRKLFVKVTRRNMMVYSMRKKYSFVYYLSIVGGFIGSFIEVTALNILAAVTLAGIALVRRAVAWRQ